MDNKAAENEFYNEVFDFLKEVIIGVETKIFKSCEEKTELREKLTSSDGMAIASNTLETYLNQVYRGLVEKNDEFLLKEFQRFDKHTSINKVNLLNLISVTAMNVYPKMKRTNLVSDKDVENYISSVRPNVEVMRKYYIFLFDKDYSKCVNSSLKESGGK